MDHIPFSFFNRNLQLYTVLNVVFFYSNGFWRPLGIQVTVCPSTWYLLVRTFTLTTIPET